MKRLNTLRRRRGSAMVEFVIAGIAGTTLMISTVQLALAMWNYHTLAQAVHETNRYVASHGRGCIGGNNCTITVGDVMTKMKSLAVGISDSDLNVTLSTSTQTKQCFPISSYYADGMQWPPNDNFDNSPGNPTTISAKLVVKSTIVQMWYGVQGQRRNTIAMTSTSSVPIVF
jgi:Tfp pilus assembly protein PilW